MDYGIIDGWPGKYWLKRSIPDTISKNLYVCNFYNKTLNTHAIIRGLNWWNDLYKQLNNTVIFKTN